MFNYDDISKIKKNKQTEKNKGIIQQTICSEMGNIF